MSEVLNQLKETISKLKEQVTERDAKIKGLEEKLVVSTNQASDLESARTFLSKKCESLSTEVVDLKESLAVAKGDKYKKDLDNTKKLVEIKNAKISELEKAIMELTEEAQVRGKLEDALRNTTSKVAAQEKKIAELNLQMDSMQENNKDLLIRLEKETERGKKLDIQLNNFKQELDILQTEARVKSAELAELDSIKVKLQEIKDANARLRAAGLELAAENANLKEEIKEKAAKIARLYEIQAEHKNEENAISTLSSEKEQLKLKLEEIESKYKIISNVNSNLTAEIKLISEKLKELKERPTGVEEKQKIIDNQAAKINRLEEQFKNAEEENKRLNEALVKSDQPELIKKVQLANKQLNERLKELQKYEQDTKLLTAEVARLKEKLRESEQLYKTKTEEMEEMKRKMNHLEQKLAQQNEIFSELSKLTQLN
eukprot:TRINITY_DN1446_c0_g1_i1.p1 TRINITY_DN1446_c0_g1~~TRINITY_DN1446_c0_g1_i1.p1  ORF type:complete len:469 (+),score=116.83 TRINITY_DN1446_c0_g1_i1:118-1407(+)